MPPQPPPGSHEHSVDEIRAGSGDRHRHFGESAILRGTVATTIRRDDDGVDETDTRASNPVECKFSQCLRAGLGRDGASAGPRDLR